MPAKNWAQAAIDLPNQIVARRFDVNGEVRVGETPLTCDAATAGSIRFDSAMRVFLGCDGKRWVFFSKRE